MYGMEKDSNTKDYEKYLKMTEEAFGFRPIKNCPVCGSEDLVHHHQKESVDCIKCGYSGGGANYWETKN